MRIGANPVRDQKIKHKQCHHRVIIPFYINTENYFKDTLAIFEKCLFSLKNHSKYNSAISVIVNGKKNRNIEDTFHALYSNEVIDELIFVSNEIGKVNSILKALRYSRESFVTITDADVFFLKEWDFFVMEVFKNFPKAAAVSPTPVFRTHNRGTYNIWFDYLFSSKLKFRKVKNQDALTKFANSIGWPWLDMKFKDVILTLQSNKGSVAVVGNSHFCVTYRTSVFKKLPYENSNFIIGGDSESKYLDNPPIFCDGYRLATYDNYAYHMGNKLEAWMENLSMEYVEKKELDLNLKPLNSKKWQYFLKFKVFRKLITIKFIKKKFLYFKGLKGNY